MSTSKLVLKERGRFHLISPDELSGIEEHTEWLEALIHNPCSIFIEDDGR